MFGSEILDVAVGLVLVFLLVSVIASAVREWIESAMKSRAGFLEHGIRELLHDKEARAGGLSRALFNHPLIYSLYAATYTPGKATDRPPRFARGRGLPSYIPARNFALALLDLAARGLETDSASADPTAPPLTTATVRASLWNLQSPPVQRVLLTALDTAGNDLEKARQAVEAWYDSGMDRVSGWYKRATQWYLFVIGLVIAAGLNVDAVNIARYLYHDDAARAAIVAQAERVSGDSTIVNASFARARAALDSLDLPIGWPRRPWAVPRDTARRDTTARAAAPALPDTVAARAHLAAARAAPPPWPETIVGWLVTALAATFGAPFWFDVLNKFMVIRATVKPREKSREEGSEDRQPKRAEGAARETGEPPAPTPTPPTPPPPTPTPVPAPTPEAEAEEDVIDACDLTHSDDAAATPATLDEHLPPATGGVG